MRRFLRRKATRLTLAALLVTAVGLVSPLSYLPNPVGLYYLLIGGYHYDPGSPFVNRFATLGSHDPTAQLSEKLDRLIGQTGLDPLDPDQPLVSYHVRRAISRPKGVPTDAAAAVVELRYADGSARTYEVPVFQRTQGAGGWRYTGLDRSLARHASLLNLPAGGPDDSVRLGPAQRLSVAPAAQSLATAPSIYWSPHWSLSGLPNETERLYPATDDRAFLLQRAGTLWFVPLTGVPPRKVAERVVRAVWSADSRYVTFIQYDRWGGFGSDLEIKRVDLLMGREATLGRTVVDRLAVAGESAYFLCGGSLWRVSLAGGRAEQLAPLPDVNPAPGDVGALAVSPDGSRVAYRCGDDICLADTSGADVSRVPLEGRLDREPLFAGSAEYRDRNSLGLAWTGDGARLAIVTGQCCSGKWPELRLVDRAGQVLRRLSIGPDGTTHEPQWTPDGRFALVNTFPLFGRRIVAIDAELGRVVDLSRPRWDAFASLAPDGTRLLLWNGRGGFWTVPLERQ